jgi:hypothetical protein
VLRISKRPEPVNMVYCPSCIWHEPFWYSRRHRPTPKNTLRGNHGCAVGPKTPTARTKETGADRSAPPGRGRKGVRAHGRERGADRRGPPVSEGGRVRGWTGPSWAALGQNGFSFFFRISKCFSFYFLKGFKPNQTTIQIQIFQTCASTKNKG